MQLWRRLATAPPSPYHPSVVKRFASAPLFLLALVVGLASGCNANWSPYAARVGTATISAGTLDGALTSISSDKGYSCLVGGGAPLSGAGTSTFSQTFVGFVLTNLIRSQVVQQEAERQHLPEPSSVVPVATAQLRASVAQALAQDPSCGSAATAWSGLSSSYRAELVHYQVAEDALAAHAEGTSLTAGDLSRFAASHPSLSQASCVSVIELTSLAEAATIRRALEKGASFSTEAHRYSKDANSAAAGGAIGCVVPGQLIQPLGPVVSRLAPGTVSAPVKFQTDYLLLLVTSRHSQPLSSLVAQLFANARTAFGQLLDEAIRSTTIAIDPRYGSWSEAPATFGQVEPPKGPPSRFVPNAGVLSQTTTTTPPSFGG